MDDNCLAKLTELRSITSVNRIEYVQRSILCRFDASTSFAIDATAID